MYGKNVEEVYWWKNTLNVCFEEFKILARKFFVWVNVLYFVRKLKSENVAVSVFSLVGMIRLVEVVHNKFGHWEKWNCGKGCKSERLASYSSK